MVETGQGGSCPEGASGAAEAPQSSSLLRFQESRPGLLRFDLASPRETLLFVGIVLALLMTLVLGLQSLLGEVAPSWALGAVLSLVCLGALRWHVDDHMLVDLGAREVRSVKTFLGRAHGRRLARLQDVYALFVWTTLVSNRRSTYWRHQPVLLLHGGSRVELGGFSRDDAHQDLSVQCAAFAERLGVPWVATAGDRELVIPEPLPPRPEQLAGAAQRDFGAARRRRMRRALFWLALVWLVVGAARCALERIG